MSHYSSKTSFEPPVRDKRKIDRDPVHVPPHKKPRSYQLVVVTRNVSEWRESYAYPSRAAREQAKAAMLKAAKADRHFRNWTRGNRSSTNTTTMDFEETDLTTS